MEPFLERKAQHLIVAMLKCYWVHNDGKVCKSKVTLKKKTLAVTQCPQLPWISNPQSHYDHLILHGELVVTPPVLFFLSSFDICLCCYSVSRDENEPATITDPDAAKPDGWLDDEPRLVPDPDAAKPDDWSV